MGWNMLCSIVLSFKEENESFLNTQYIRVRDMSDTLFNFSS